MRRARISRIILAAMLLVSSWFLIGCSSSAAGDKSTGPAVRVFYAGPDARQRGVFEALKIAETGGFVSLVSDPNLADVFVLNGTVPDGIAPRMKNGAGLVLISGSDLTNEAVSALLGAPITLTKVEDAVSLVDAVGVNDPLVQGIDWKSATQVRERAQFHGLNLHPIIVRYLEYSVQEPAEVILGSTTIGKSPVFVFTASLGADNLSFQDWSYFNYLIYHLAERAGGKVPLVFGDYPGSPVPHEGDRNVLLVIMLALVITSFGVFAWVRRYSRAHPELLDVIVADSQDYQAREEGTPWEEVGFHRPLSGFLVALTMGLVLFIPYILYQNFILPTFILPSAQAIGIWDRVTQTFNLAWMFFDMGTSVAFIKYLSEYRVHDPKKGIQFGQLFIWWQALSGAIQVAIVVILASTALPHTAFAIYAWSIIIHTFIQLPGFYQVMRHALNGLQRSDYARILEIGLNLILPMLIQPIFVSIMFAWGKANPIFGESLGGLLGLGIAAYAAELCSFLIGVWFYRRIGYNIRILFLAHFDWSIIKTSFKFGVFEMLGSVAWSVGQAAEIGITQLRLINYAEIWGNWRTAQNFIFAFSVITSLYDGVMPSISEAFSSGRRLLSQYYTVNSYKWGGMVSAFIGAVLLAVADRFILGATGKDFARAAVYVIPLTFWGAVQYISWVGDNVQLGANRPYLKSLLIFGEQTVRIVLAWVLLERFQITGLIIAYFIGLLAKGLTAYFINHRVCYPQRYYFWQSLAAPLLAGAAHFAWLRWFTGLIWQNDQVTSVLIFFIGILPSFPVFMFLYGFFGGWDVDTLDELKNAVDLTGGLRPLAWLIWSSSALGARISPLHGRFPINIRIAAIEEAKALTAEKIRL